MNNYDDIINLKHHVSIKHPQMSMEARAAQFAPFAALTGYNEAVKEQERLTYKKKELTDEIKDVLNEKIQNIYEKIYENPKVKITYFLADNKKDGGEYKEVTGNVKKIDRYNQLLILTDNIKIYILDIYDIEIL